MFFSILFSTRKALGYIVLLALASLVSNCKRQAPKEYTPEQKQGECEEEAATCQNQDDREGDSARDDQQDDNDEEGQRDRDHLDDNDDDQSDNRDVQGRDDDEGDEDNEDEANDHQTTSRQPSTDTNQKVKFIENTGHNKKYNIYHPEVGSNFPVIIWANATMTPASTYKSFTEYMAKHGFLVLVSQSSATGDGKVLLEGLDWLLKTSSFKNKIDKKNIGSIGHSQGGASAYVISAKDSRIKTSVPLHPDCNFWVKCGEGANVPVLAIAGKKDTLVSSKSVKSKIYSKGDNVVFAENKSTGHMEWMGKIQDTYGKAVMSWFGYHLKGNKKAMEYFSEGGEMASSNEWNMEFPK